MTLRIFYLVLLISVVNSVSYAAQIRQGEAFLSSDKSFVLPEGQEQTIQVNLEVKNLPAVYGVDIVVVFDAEKLQMMDGDEQRKGIQAVVGPFLKSDRSFLLRNKGDNQAGRFEYTMSLLNPAPEVKGDGLLLEIPFQVVAQAGKVKMTVEKIEFGTRNGDTVIPEIISELVISIGEKPPKESPYILVLIIVGVLILLSIIVVAMKKRKK